MGWWNEEASRCETGSGQVRVKEQVQGVWIQTGSGISEGGIDVKQEEGCLKRRGE